MQTNTTIRYATSGEQGSSKLQDIVLTVFVHRGVPDSFEDLPYNYFEHWAKAMNHVTGRDVVIDFVKEDNDITQLDYRSDDESRPLAELNRLFRLYRQNDSHVVHAKLRKAVLVTRVGINDRIGGLAYVKGRVGIASLIGYCVPAHELGHMFGATHENSDNGWSSLTDSYMAPSHNRLKVKSYGFTQENEDLIAAYLSDVK